MHSYYIKRILFERKLIRKHFPQFELVKGCVLSFVGWHKTTIGNNRYRMRLVLPHGYPDKMPNLYVTYPRNLHKIHSAKPLESYSHAFHTHEVAPGDYVEVCHHTSHSWNANNTSIGVLSKGLMWLDAYEAYLRNGKSINDIIEAWTKTNR